MAAKASGTLQQTRKYVRFGVFFNVAKGVKVQSRKDQSKIDSEKVAEAFKS
jgi:hypothetical protein